MSPTPQIEAAVEADIQAKGLAAPRLTPAHIDSVIAAEDYHRFANTTLIVCALTLRNGYVVTGQSAAASPANFDATIGRKIARDDARAKIWALEGYLLRERLTAPDTTAIAAILAERRQQDAEWGGPSHDDTHVPAEWLEIASYQIDRGYSECTGGAAASASAVRARLVKVAAVALAGIQSIDRTAQPPGDTPA